MADPDGSAFFASVLPPTVLLFLWVWGLVGVGPLFGAHVIVSVDDQLNFLISVAYSILVTKNRARGLLIACLLIHMMLLCGLPDTTQAFFISCAPTALT